MQIWKTIELPTDIITAKILGYLKQRGSVAKVSLSLWCFHCDVYHGLRSGGGSGCIVLRWLNQVKWSQVVSDTGFTSAHIFNVQIWFSQSTEIVLSACCDLATKTKTVYHYFPSSCETLSIASVLARLRLVRYVIRLWEFY